MGRKKQEPAIIIPIGDWLDEYVQEEVDVTSEDAVVKAQMDNGYHPAKLGRLLIIAQERGETEEGIIPKPKTLLNTGAALEVSQMFARRKRMIQAPSGHEYEARELVAQVREYTDGDEDGNGSNDNGFEEAVDAVFASDDSPAFVFVDDALAIDRAFAYLEKRVPGYIWGRLLTISQSGSEEVRKAADMIHEKVDEMVERLVEPRVT